MYKSLCLLGAAALIAVNAPAAAMSEQWLTRYAPPLSNASSTPAPVSTDSTATRADAQKQQVVIKNLRGVALIDKPTMVRKRGVSVEGVSADPKVFPARVREVAEAYLGKSLTFGDLDQLTRALVLAFRAENRPVVNVVAPE